MYKVNSQHQSRDGDVGISWQLFFVGLLQREQVKQHTINNSSVFNSQWFPEKHLCHVKQCLICICIAHVLKTIIIIIIINI